MCNTNTVLLDHEKSTIASKLYSGKFGDPGGGLGDYFDRGNVCGVWPHNSLKTRFLGRCADVPTALDELAFQGLVDGRMRRDRIVGEATRRVIESLGGGNRLRSIVEVGSLVDNMH